MMIYQVCRDDWVDDWTKDGYDVVIKGPCFETRSDAEEYIEKYHLYDYVEEVNVVMHENIGKHRIEWELEYARIKENFKKSLDRALGRA